MLFDLSRYRSRARAIDLSGSSASYAGGAIYITHVFDRYLPTAKIANFPKNLINAGPLVWLFAEHRSCIH